MGGDLGFDFRHEFVAIGPERRREVADEDDVRGGGEKEGGGDERENVVALGLGHPERRFRIEGKSTVTSSQRHMRHSPTPPTF